MRPEINLKKFTYSNYRIDSMNTKGEKSSWTDYMDQDTAEEYCLDMEYIQGYSFTYVNLNPAREIQDF